MARRNGMVPNAWKAYLKACQGAGLQPRDILQTVGNAKASANTHKADGSFKNEQGAKEFYTAAADIRTKDLTEKQIHKLLLNLARNGFAAWWRHEGSFKNNQHIHAIYANVPMKRSLRNQVHSFLARRSGLVGDATDFFWKKHLNEETEQFIRTLFLKHNPMNFDPGVAFDVTEDEDLNIADIPLDEPEDDEQLDYQLEGDDGVDGDDSGDTPSDTSFDISGEDKDELVQPCGSPEIGD